MRSFALLIALTTVAHAQPSLTPLDELPLSPPSATPPVDDVIPGEDSYRYQTVLVDLAAIALIAAGTQYDTQDDTLSTAGLLVYALGAPAVHAVHGRGLYAGLSLGMRVLLPLAGGAVGAAAGGSDEDGLIVGALLGITIGAGTAMVIDSAVLAKGTSPRRRGLMPAVRPTSGGATVGVSGVF